MAKTKTDTQVENVSPNPVDEVVKQIKSLNDRMGNMETNLDSWSRQADSRATGNPFTLPAQVKSNPDMPHQFKSLSHFCRDVYRAGLPNSGGMSMELKAWTDIVTKAASGMNEAVGSEGGFLVPPTLSTEVWRRTYDNDLLQRTKSYTTSGNSFTLNAIDETSRANGSRFGGVRAYWRAEAAQFTGTKPAFNQVEMKLKELIGLWYATTELLEDAGTSVEQLMTDLFSQEIAFMIGDAIINGSGAGVPLGILNMASLVTVSKETGQGAATVLYENINKMWARMYAPSRKNAVWFINQDVEPALDVMTLNVGTGGMPVYLPPGGVADEPYGRLKGRPVIPIEFCATLGTVGDIILADMSQYVTLRKGETKADSSLHLRFDYAETAFRVMFRMDGATPWVGALTPFKGSATQSPFVALATRS